jgi:hypothetical protein
LRDYYPSKEAEKTIRTKPAARAADLPKKSLWEITVWVDFPHDTKKAPALSGPLDRKLRS